MMFVILYLNRKKMTREQEMKEYYLFENIILPDS